MDERSLDWIHLLPPDNQILVQNAPDALRKLLERQAASVTSNTLLTYHFSSKDTARLREYESAVLVNPRGTVSADLNRAGFRHTSAFVVLPSLSRPKWYVPLQNRRVAAKSFALLGGFRRTGKARKQVVSLLAQLGLLHRFGDTLVIARRGKSTLEEQLEHATGVSPIFLAIRTGVLSDHRKSVMQVMAENGGIVAYAKLASSPGAAVTLNRAIACLQEFAAYRQLEGAVPKLMGAFSIADKVISVESPAPPTVGPTVFGPAHLEFLQGLSSTTERRMPFCRSGMWRSIEEQIQTLEPRLSGRWRERLGFATQRVQQHLGKSELEVSMAHRDFAPWNTRMHEGGRLFVFDWELAQPETIPLYDLMHFHFASYALISRRRKSSEIAQQIFAACRRWFPQHEEERVRHLFLAYLVDRAIARLHYVLWRRSSSKDDFLQMIEELLDDQAEWLPVNDPS